MTWLLRLLEQMSPVLVEALKKGLRELLDDLQKKAKETPNEWDDWGVKMLRKVLLNE